MVFADAPWNGEDAHDKFPFDTSQQLFKAVVSSIAAGYAGIV